MSHVRWFLLNAADVDAAITDCEPQHRRTTNDNALSVTWSADHTKALVKCDGADKAWRAGFSWIRSALVVLDNDTHDKWTKENFYTTEWQGKEV